ncbi:MAG: hypothetical protein ACFCUL_09135 [Flavobacteriaceae bacterium]
MKKIVRSIAVVALMIMTITVSAKEPKLSLTANAEKSLTFELDAQSHETKISMVDYDDNVIYAEKIQGVLAYSKKFDLKNLPIGNYFLFVENELKKTVYTINVTSSMVEIVERKENAKPVFRKTGERVFLNLLNLDKEVVNITVYDSENRIVFKEAVKDEMLVEKVFNFDKAYAGNYTIVVNDGEDTFYEDVLVK